MHDEDRAALYRALDDIGDALLDGYRSGHALPDFEALISPDSLDSPPDSTAPKQDPAGPRSRGGLLGRDSDNLNGIAADIMRCRACRLVSARRRPIAGSGSNQAALFIIGERPDGSDEDSATAMSGAAGALMTRMLLAIGLDRSRDCFVTTAVKCRPPMDREPAPDEQAACQTFIERQIQIIGPRAILTFGRIPAQLLLGRRDGLARLRGQIHDWRGIPLVATHHPAAILLDETLKRPAWEDLKLIKTILSDD